MLPLLKLLTLIDVRTPLVALTLRDSTRQLHRRDLEAGDVDAFLRRVRMLAHQGLDPAALATLDRFDDHVMLPMRVLQNGRSCARRLIRSKAIACGPANGHAAVARKRLGQDLAAGLLEDEAVKAAVHLGVGRLVALLDAALCEQRVAVVQTGAQLAQERLRGAVLGDAPCRKPLEDAAHVDRVEHVSPAVNARTT